MVKNHPNETALIPNSSNALIPTPTFLRGIVLFKKSTPQSEVERTLRDIEKSLEGVEHEILDSASVWSEFEDWWNDAGEEVHQRYGKIYNAWTDAVNCYMAKPWDKIPTFNVFIVPEGSLGMATKQILTQALEAQDRVVVQWMRDEGQFYEVLEVNPRPGQRKVSWQDGFMCKLGEDLDDLAGHVADLDEELDGTKLLEG